MKYHCLQDRRKDSGEDFSPPVDLTRVLGRGLRGSDGNLEVVHQFLVHRVRNDRTFDDLLLFLEEVGDDCPVSSKTALVSGEEFASVFTLGDLTNIEGYRHACLVQVQVSVVRELGAGLCISRIVDGEELALVLSFFLDRNVRLVVSCSFLFDLDAHMSLLMCEYRSHKNCISILMKMNEY